MMEQNVQSFSTEYDDDSSNDSDIEEYTYYYEDDDDDGTDAESSSSPISRMLAEADREIALNPATAVKLLQQVLTDVEAEEEDEQLVAQWSYRAHEYLAECYEKLQRHDELIQSMKRLMALAVNPAVDGSTDEIREVIDRFLQSLRSADVAVPIQLLIACLSSLEEKAPPNTSASDPFPVHSRYFGLWLYLALNLCRRVDAQLQEDQEGKDQRTLNPVLYTKRGGVSTVSYLDLLRKIQNHCLGIDATTRRKSRLFFLSAVALESAVLTRENWTLCPLTPRGTDHERYRVLRYWARTLAKLPDTIPVNAVPERVPEKILTTSMENDGMPTSIPVFRYLNNLMKEKDWLVQL